MTAVNPAREADLSAGAQRVLALLRAAGAPVKAYDLLAQFEPGKLAKPPTIYRALKRLARDGLVHRVLTLDAYAHCCLPSGDHQPVFLICRSCGKTTETAAPAAVTKDVNPLGSGFVAETMVMEVTGLCRQCRTGQLPADRE